METDIMLTSFFWHETYIALIHLIEGEGCLYSLSGLFLFFDLLLPEHHKGLPLHPQFPPAPSLHLMSFFAMKSFLCSSICFTNNKMLINILFILFCWTFTLITSYILGRLLFPWLQRKTTHKENTKQLDCERCAWGGGGGWWFGGGGQTRIGDGFFSTCFYPFPELK